MSGRRPKVVITHWVHPAVLREASAFATVVAPESCDIMAPGEVLRHAADAEGLVACMADRVDAAFLAACPHLRVIAATLKGWDNFDAAACTARGVWLTALPDMLTAPTAELVIALTLGLLRHVGPGDRAVREGFAGWRPTLYGRALGESRVGVIGMGQLGQAVVRLMAPFGPSMSYYDPDGLSEAQDAALGVNRCASLAALLERSDVLLPLVPLSAGTLHLLDGSAIQRLPPGAFIVNAGRGSVVDEQAVVDALADGQLAGYAADVFAFEDWALVGRPAGIHPALLANREQTLFTPHLGSAVDRVREAMSLAAVGQVRQALAGLRPDLAVNEGASVVRSP